MAAQQQVPMFELSSSKTASRLQQVAAWRARGIGDHISLPQLVVCGDQSVGKSSVLEGVTGLPFPRQDGLCTRFATEILLTHLEDAPTTMTATIIPADSRTEDSATKLSAFRHIMSGLEDLPNVIEQVGQMLEIRGFGDVRTGPSFSHDLLRIEVSGATGMHLSVVDLPGIITVTNEQQDEGDIALVHDLIHRYLQNPRTIILAVVQAGNDIANQSVIKKLRASISLSIPLWYG